MQTFVNRNNETRMTVNKIIPLNNYYVLTAEIIAQNIIPVKNPKLMTIQNVVFKLLNFTEFFSDF